MSRAGQLRVILGGGVGSGKSTFGSQLAALGAHRVDADQVARDVVEPGSPGLAAVVERFGPTVLTPDGALDRPALAAVVFADEQARLDLNAILHPVIAAESNAQMNAAPDGAVVIYEVPLLQARVMDGSFDYVVVVVAPVELRLRRLEGRGMSAADARARMAAQISDAELLAMADEAVVNDSDTAALSAKAEDLWERLSTRSVQLRARSMP